MTTGRRRLDAAARRLTIIEAAARVFSDSGYEKARMADVAEQIGVSEPVVFQNFGSKAALFAATLEHVAEAYAAHLGQVAAHTTDAFEALASLTDPEAFRRLHRRGGAGVLFADAASARDVPAVRRAMARIHRALADLFEAGQRQGVIRADVEAGTLAWWVLSIFPAHAFRHAHGVRSRDDEGRLHRLALELLRPAPQRARSRR